MDYVTTRLVNLDHALFEEGDAIAFTDRQSKAKAELLACGAVIEGKSKSVTVETIETPIDGMTRKELEAIAAAEGVDLAAAKTNGDRVTAIKAKRAEVAPAAAGGAGGQAQE